MSRFHFDKTAKFACNLFHETAKSAWVLESGVVFMSQNVAMCQNGCSLLGEFSVLKFVVL